MHEQANDQGSDATYNCLADKGHSYLGAGGKFFSDLLELPADLLCSFTGSHQHAFGILHHKVGIAGVDHCAIKVAEKGHYKGSDAGNKDPGFDGLLIGQGTPVFNFCLLHAEIDPDPEDQDTKQAGIRPDLGSRDALVKEAGI